jgi:hypothetical protein
MPSSERVLREVLMYYGNRISLRIGLLLGVLGLAQATSAQIPSAEFRGAMRTLWENHVTWTHPDALSSGIMSQHPDKFRG